MGAAGGDRAEGRVGSTRCNARISAGDSGRFGDSIHHTPNMRSRATAAAAEIAAIRAVCGVQAGDCGGVSAGNNSYPAAVSPLAASARISRPSRVADAEGLGSSAEAQAPAAGGSWTGMERGTGTWTRAGLANKVAAGFRTGAAETVARCPCSPSSTGFCFVAACGSAAAGDGVGTVGEDVGTVGEDASRPTTVSLASNSDKSRLPSNTNRFVEAFGFGGWLRRRLLRACGGRGRRSVGLDRASASPRSSPKLRRGRRNSSPAMRQGLPPPPPRARRRPGVGRGGRFRRPVGRLFLELAVVNDLQRWTQQASLGDADAIVQRVAVFCRPGPADKSYQPQPLVHALLDHTAVRLKSIQAEKAIVIRRQILLREAQQLFNGSKDGVSIAIVFFDSVVNGGAFRFIRPRETGLPRSIFVGAWAFVPPARQILTRRGVPFPALREMSRSLPQTGLRRHFSGSSTLNPFFAYNVNGLCSPRTGTSGLPGRKPWSSGPGPGSAQPIEELEERRRRAALRRRRPRRIEDVVGVVAPQAVLRIGDYRSWSHRPSAFAR